MRKNMLCKLGCLAMAAVLAAGLLPGRALAAQETKAVTMSLEATEGTVSLTNARGKSLTAKDGTKLYSGYTISTAAASYAWISLDDDVVVKLDASSKATVKRNHKKLEVMLSSGKLFFNVSKPIAEDASLDIRTSSMSTGVRGTSGLVEVEQSVTVERDSSGQSVAAHTSVSTLVIYDGRVTVAYKAPETSSGEEGESKEETVLVSAGWQARVVQTVTEKQDGIPAVTQASVNPVSVKGSLSSAGFAMVEVARDEALYDRIVSEKNDLDAETAAELVPKAEQQLKKEQAAATETAREQEEELEKARQENRDQLEAAPPPPTKPIFTPPMIVPTQPDPPTDPGQGEDRMVTVTFLYNDGGEEVIYATQQVIAGRQAVRPTLQPGPSGMWQSGDEEYDFTQPVADNLTLMWKPA